MGERIEIIRPKPSQTLLETAHGPAYPFCLIQLKQTTKLKPPILTLEVGSKLYESLVDQFGEDRIALYYDLASGIVGAWTKDMMITFRILSELKLMSPLESWFSRSREYMMNFLAKQKSPIPQASHENEEALTIAEEILRASGVLEEIKSKPHLFAVAKDVIMSGTKDPDTIIYRLAMAVYHSKRIAGEPAIPKLEDPASIYLSLTEDESFLKKYPSVLKALTEVPAINRSETVRTFISFVIGTFLYNSVILGGGH
ncbi:MAG: hypothetical protein QXD42_03980 [Nitrososphaerales archaeon]